MNPILHQAQATMNRPLYQRGDSGPEVKLVQQYLAGAGFSPGAIDGKYGDKTVAAVATFQRSVGLNPDGIVWLETFNALANAGRPVPAPGHQYQEPSTPEYVEETTAPVPKWAIYIGLAAAGAVALYYLTKRGSGRPAMAGYSDEDQCSCGPRHSMKQRRIRS